MTVLRTRLNNRTISLAVAKNNGLKVPKDFKKWTWKEALKKLNANSAKAEKARAEFKELSGYPVPDGSFRDLITGRVAKATPKKSKKISKKNSKKSSKVAKATKKEAKASKESSKKNSSPSKDGIDYDKLAKAIVKQQARAEADKSARASKEANDRYHSDMELKRMNWSSQFKGEDKAKKPSASFKKGKDDIIPKGEALLKKSK